MAAYKPRDATKRDGTRAPREPTTGATTRPAGDHYEVKPGYTEPEFFAPTLKGMDVAIARAAFISVGSAAPQEVISHRADQERVIYAFENGVTIARPSVVIPRRETE